MRRPAAGLLALALAAVPALLPLTPVAAAPVEDPYVDSGSGALSLSVLSSIETGVFDASAAEIVAHDPESQQLFVVNASAGLIDVFDVSDPEDPSKVGVLDATGLQAADGSTVPAGTQVNSVDVREDGIVAVAIESPDKTDPGYAAFFTTDRESVTAVRVGALPDMLTFTPDERTLLVANEGEPSEDFTVDPEGSVSVVDVSGDVEDLGQDDVRTADFAAYDEGEALPEGVRVFGPDVENPPGPGRVARTLEPEYIVTDSTGTTAHVALQEANAFAVVDIDSAEVTDLLPLGTKDHTQPGNELDVSDRDGAENPDPEEDPLPEINIRDRPIQGLFMPDGIGSYEAGSGPEQGEQFIVTANEGDAREFGDYEEAQRIKDLTLCDDADFGGYVGPDAEFATVEELQTDENLGRLNATIANGLREGEDCYEELFSFGARSFAIFSADGELVFDSGSDFEQLTADLEPDFFNSNHTEANLEGRSEDKGPEPEGVAIGELGGRTYAFVGFERVGGIAVYDVTDPLDTEFTTYINNRDFTAYEGEEPTDAELATAGDLGTEGLVVIAAEDSPVPGVPLLAVANEVSGTTTLYTIDVELPAPPFDRGIARACPGDYPRTFADIAGNVHEDAIRCAAEAGLTRGTDMPGQYGPERSTTRGQMASFVARFIASTTGEALEPGPDAFGDDTGSVHAGAIDALAALGVVEGVRPGSFEPLRTVSRGQMAAFLARAVDVLDDGERNGSLPPATEQDVFSDDNGSTHEQAIDRLAVQGVVQGTGSGMYQPLLPVRRDQLASFLMRSYDLAVERGLAEPVE